MDVPCQEGEISVKNIPVAIPFSYVSNVSFILRFNTFMVKIKERLFFILEICLTLCARHTSEKVNMSKSVQNFLILCQANTYGCKKSGYEEAYEIFA